jgi:anti-sigma factor RsiW
MILRCRDVIRELSNYIDDDVDAAWRRAIAEHLAGCVHCSAIYDGTSNVVRLIGDERVFELPPGFGQRLRQRLSLHHAQR